MSDAKAQEGDLPGEILVHLDVLLARRKMRSKELADRIAELALADPRARRAEVTVEKLDVFPDAEGAGVTVTRRRPA